MLANLVTCLELSVHGKSTFKDEFVTAGGIDLDEVDFKTMESKLLPNLFFGGEILDVDAVTGGFNFQAAWTTTCKLCYGYFKNLHGIKTGLIFGEEIKTKHHEKNLPAKRFVLLCAFSFRSTSPAFRKTNEKVGHQKHQYCPWYGNGHDLRFVSRTAGQHDQRYSPVCI